MSFTYKNGLSKRLNPPFVTATPTADKFTFGEIIEDGNYAWLAYSNELHVYDLLTQKKKSVFVFEEEGELQVVTSIEIIVKGISYLLVSLQPSKYRSKGQLRVLHLRTSNTVRVIDSPYVITSFTNINKVNAFNCDF